MPDFELAHQTAEALETLKLDLDIKHLANGLEVKQPNAEVTMMRVTAIRSKLIRAYQLIAALEAVLKK